MTETTEATERHAPLLAMRGIVKSFGPVRALHGVDLRVRPAGTAPRSSSSSR